MGCIRSQPESNEQKGLLHKPVLPRHRTINQCQYPQAYQAWAAPYQNKSPYHNRTSFNSIVLRNCLQIIIEVNRLKACKIVLVGDQGVGKTSLLHRYCDDIFEVARPYKSTISMGYEVRAFEILSIPYNVQIWDTAGERRWQEIAVDYCRYVDVVIMVFDFHDFDTLGNIEKWKKLVDEKINEAFFFLVGSKKDIVSDPWYKNVDDHAVTIAERLGMEYWAVSSKTGERVRDLFARAATLSFEKHILHLLNDENYSPHKKRRFMNAKQMMAKKGNKETQTVYRTLSIQHSKSESEDAEVAAAPVEEETPCCSCCPCCFKSKQRTTKSAELVYSKEIV